LIAAVVDYRAYIIYQFKMFQYSSLLVGEIMVTVTATFFLHSAVDATLETI
jgi:hypothetical protein